ncbi:4-(cytidine 5'-diphospho)-2-C-methyl-D-erythritol kinase [Pistricoccus aurantiacus]|uniref:4-(cytidine 5'-diphospho)-2-C-methyl-D-erythritol kinase n=1 Tax=Pistricoccus aurantiacus TaxID=1883414 RepID=UPI0036269079
MNEALTLPSPAKLNRMLHITGRIEAGPQRGYHRLQTLFQFLDIGDTLSFRPRDDGELRLSPQISGVNEQDNLILRAARKLQEESGTRLGADILLDKRLPLGGGLGGGSSNAATTLLALDHLWDLGYSRQHLAGLGLALGADVPVFLLGRAAWAEGVGEQLTPVELDTPFFLVVHPGVSVSTPAIFQAPQLTRHSPPITMARALQRGASSWRNDCEATVCALYPQVAEAREWLSGFAPTLLTGTGACLFARFDSADQAAWVKQQIDHDWQAFVARGVNVSPLHAALGCRH